jgi:hypothetical protein
MRKFYYWWGQPSPLHTITRGGEQADLATSLHMLRDGSAMVSLASAPLRSLQYTPLKPESENPWAR